MVLKNIKKDLQKAVRKAGIARQIEAATILDITNEVLIEVFGKYTIIFQLYLIFQITSPFGLRLLLTREVARQKDQVNKYLINGTLLSIPAVILNIGIMVLMVNWLAEIWGKISLWASNQPVFVEVAIGIALFYVVLLISRAV